MENVDLGDKEGPQRRGPNLRDRSRDHDFGVLLILALVAVPCFIAAAIAFVFL